MVFHQHRPRLHYPDHHLVVRVSRGGRVLVDALNHHHSTVVHPRLHPLCPELCSGIAVRSGGHETGIVDETRADVELAPWQA